MKQQVIVMLIIAGSSWNGHDFILNQVTIRYFVSFSLRCSFWLVDAKIANIDKCP